MPISAYNRAQPSRLRLRAREMLGCHAHGFAWAWFDSMPTQSRGHGTQKHKKRPRKIPMKRVLLSLGALLFPLSAHAAEIDLNRAIVVAPTNLAGPERKAVEMLVDEVQKRTRLRWEVAPTIAEGERPFILIGQSEPPNAVNHQIGRAHV